MFKANELYCIKTIILLLLRVTKDDLFHWDFKYIKILQSEQFNNQSANQYLLTIYYIWDSTALYGPVLKTGSHVH